MSRATEFGEAPPPDASIGEFAAFIAHGYGLPDGYTVARVIRYGGRDGTGIAVFIRPPGGGSELRILYEREADCQNPAKLRSRAAADTRGLTRSGLLTSQKAALAMYEAMCSMAEHFEAADQRGQTWEWVQQLHRVAAVTPGHVGSYQALRRLQDHDYSKRLVQDPPTDKHGRPQRVMPLLLEDTTTGYMYVTARHMAVFLRYDLGVEDAGSDDRILTRLIEIGGDRLNADQWDSTTRAREHRIRLVLYRLPEEAPDE
jgi:hypothetical protein